MVSIEKSTNITVITGAGISKASGLPTFRGKDGLWRKYSASELATPIAFNRDPQLIWEWYKWRISLVLNSQPNAAHLFLANWEKNGNDVVILTQNVDDLHERAGSSNVIHLHGQILKTRCINCHNVGFWTLKTLKTSKIVPKCSLCNSIIRPDVIWFGENLKQDIIEQSFIRLSITQILIIIGTSGIVFPVAEFPFFAKQKNQHLKIYEFNLEYTPLSELATKTILGPVEETLPEFFSFKDYD
jgi:NAD-dependent deacetylase